MRKHKLFFRNNIYVCLTHLKKKLQATCDAQVTYLKRQINKIKYIFLAHTFLNKCHL